MKQNPKDNRYFFNLFVDNKQILNIQRQQKAVGLVSETVKSIEKNCDLQSGQRQTDRQTDKLTEEKKTEGPIDFFSVSISGPK